MLIALLLAPVVAGLAVGAVAEKSAAASRPAVTTYNAHATTPCHKPALKPCPHCPQKTACPDMMGCLAKCAQVLAHGPSAQTGPVAIVFMNLAGPAHATAVRDQLIPPLLRPPIV